MLPRALLSETVPRRPGYSRLLFWTRLTLRALGLGRFGPWHLLVFLAGTLLTAAATATLIHYDYELASSYWQARLEMVADDRASVISRYLQRRLQNAQRWSAVPAFRAWMTLRVGNGHGKPLRAGHQVLDDFLGDLTSIYPYPGVIVVDSQGEVLAATSAARQSVQEALALCRKVAHDGVPQIAFLDVLSGKPLLVFAVPIEPSPTAASAVGERPSVAGVLAVFSDPAADVVPVLKCGPTASRTEESVLIHSEGSQALFLLPPRKLANPALFSMFPIESVNPLIHAAFEGREIVGPVIDYRGARVIAAVRPLSQSGWVLEEKIDSEEAYEHWRRTARLESLCAGLLALVLAAALAGHRHHQRSLQLIKEAEHRQVILRAERYANDIVDSVPAWLVALTPDLRVQSANRSFLQYFDVGSDEIQGVALGDIMRTERLLRQVDQAAKGQATVEEVILEVGLRGKEIKLPARVTLVDLVRGVEGKPEVLLVVEDLTETEHLRLTSEARGKALHETEVRYRALETSADFIGTHDLEGTILNVTPAVALRVGFTDPEAMTGLKVADFLPPDRRPEFDAYLDTLRREGRAQGIMKAIMLGGEEVMVEFKNSVLREGRDPNVVLCVGRDVSEIVRMRKALKRSRQFRQDLVNTASSGIARLDVQGLFTFANDRATEICGYTADELIGKPFPVLLPPEEVKGFDEFMRSSLAGGVQMLARDVTFVRKDGSRRSIRLHITYLVSGGISMGMVMAWRDLTELRTPEVRDS